jgi:drug/metabolite transporter (DMT)-like permease
LMIEIPLLLALGSALSWGAGDFFGGLATREAKALGTTFISQAVGLIGLIFVSLLGAGGSFVGTDLAWGIGASLCSMVGLGLFYEAMGRGSFGAVVSITSVVSGAIPIGIGLLMGERPSPLALGGVGFAVLAIWLIAGEKRKADEAGSNTAMLLAVGAGVLFGGYFVLLSRTSETSGLWPLVAGRATATAALGLTILILGYGNANAAWVPPRGAFKLCLAAGFLDAAANALYFYASRRGLLSVVAVIASLYPASTIVLARIALRERVNRRRLAGMMVGFVAVAVIASGGESIPATVPGITEFTPNELVLVDPVESPIELEFGNPVDYSNPPDVSPMPSNHLVFSDGEIQG